MSRESTRGIHRLTQSMDSSESEFGSSDYASYRISVPPTPDNQVPSLEIVLHDPKNKTPSVDDQDELSEDFEDPKTPLRKNKDLEKWKSLTQTVKISPAILAMYWITVFIRVISLVLFILWRITHQNDDASWLWGMSVTCEIWFSLVWFLDQLTKLRPVSRTTDLDLLKEQFETPNPENPTGKSDLPGTDVFVYTADSVKEPPLTTANAILSILAVDYPVEKLACYVSDEGGSLLMFETMAEAGSFAKIWVPFCRKHEIEPRNPESYFGLKRDPYKDKVRSDFVRERRAMKRKYDEFKVRVNALSDSIRRRSEAYNSQEEIRALAELKQRRSDDQSDDDEPNQRLKLPKATWMSDGTYWPGTWTVPAPHHSCCDHPSILQVLLHPPGDEPVKGFHWNKWMDFSEVDTRLPMLIYVSRERRPGYDHNEKAGAMNALLRGSAVLSNGPFILNLDCDHYIYNSKALREGTCFMMNQNGGHVCYVQFSQRFEETDPSKHYGNSDSILFDINMRALDGIQGPMYAGTGCLFRRTALYGFGPNDDWDDDESSNAALIPKKFGNSDMMLRSIKNVVYQGKPFADTPFAERGRQPWSGLTNTRERLNVFSVSEAVNLMACWFEDKTEWGFKFGWIYGTVTEDVLTGYMMHNKGWRSVYCVTKPDAFRKTALVNITDGLHLLLRRAMGSVEILFSRNNAILGNPRLKFLQRIAYLNVGIYPFSSIFLIVYCFLPALSLFSGKFMVKSFNLSFLVYLLVITLTSCALAIIETHWSDVTLQQWWRNEQFRFIGGTSSHLVAVIQGILKSVTGIVIPFSSRSKKPRGDIDDEYADLYLIKWTALMIPPLTIILLNVIAIFYGFSRKIYGNGRQWSNFIGGVGFVVWVLVHLYPFVRGLMGRRGKAPTILYIWSGLVAITLSLLVLAISPPPENPAGISILITPGFLN